MPVFPPLFPPFLPVEHQPLGTTNVPGTEGLGLEGVWSSPLPQPGAGCLDPAGVWHESTEPAAVARLHSAEFGIELIYVVFTKILLCALRWEPLHPWHCPHWKQLLLLTRPDKTSPRARGGHRKSPKPYCCGSNPSDRAGHEPCPPARASRRRSTARRRCAQGRAVTRTPCTKRH